MEFALSTFVLVHGAWTGGFSWRDVRRCLYRKGHEVLTPTLTGLGERVHLGGQSVNLHLHVQDIVNVLKYEDLHDVILVGHSYGGMVITMVADQEFSRIRDLVYLDAFLPSAGESLNALRQNPSVMDAWVPPPAFRETDWARLSRLLAESRLSLQPRETFEQAVVLSKPIESRLFRRTYVLAVGQGSAWQYQRAAAYARSHPAWEYEEIVGDHDMMITEPEKVATLLHTISQKSALLTDNFLDS
jgi:pimeloyl-ACP methyl ester carboxylesterase